MEVEIYKTVLTAREDSEKGLDHIAVYFQVVLVNLNLNHREEDRIHCSGRNHRIKVTNVTKKSMSEEF